MAKSEYDTRLMRILDTARWAPSGDNKQYWRFHPLDESSLYVHYTIPPDNLYDSYQEGKSVHYAVGMLLETMRLAATNEGMQCTWEYVGQQEGSHRIHVQFTDDPSIEKEWLYNFIPHRSVNRLSYQTTVLKEPEKKALGEALGDDLSIEWHEGKNKKNIAKLNALATDIRLRIPELYPVHCSFLEWNKPFSEDRIPVGTLPINPLSLFMMRWALKSWKRVDFMNRYMGGTKAPQLEMDIIPGTHCAGHFLIASKHNIAGDIPAILRTGERLQRFWLTATSLGLVMHPGFAALVFADYSRENTLFTTDSVRQAAAKKLEAQLKALTRLPANQLVFAGRIGHPKSPEITSRSTRKPLEALLD